MQSFIGAVAAEKQWQAAIGAYLARMMTNQILAERIAAVAGGRATVQLEGARASVILDVTGLDRRERDAHGGRCARPRWPCRASPRCASR